MSDSTHFSDGDAELIDAVSNHIEEHIGEVEYVYHELASPDIHVDIHVVKPTKKRPYYSLVTSGMAELPMVLPEDIEGSPFAELLICLPQNWPMRQEDFKQEENYWPIRLLKALARHPHIEKTWMSSGHSWVASDPPEPFASNTKMSSALLLQPKLIPESAQIIHVREDRHALLWAVFPLYQEELELKLERGSGYVEQLFAQNGVTELLEVKRRSVVPLN